MKKTQKRSSEKPASRSKSKKQSTQKKTSSKTKSSVRHMSAEAAEIEAEKKAQEDAKSFRPSFQAPRGMEDVLWQEQSYWHVVFETFRNLCTSFNMLPISVPIAEDVSLYTKGVGEQTDIIEKEMFFVRDKTGKTQLALRPEFTVGIVRAYLEHGLSSWPQPVRLWYYGPVFRHERPQAGRYRQSTQFGSEIIGEGNPIIDVQLIHMVYELYTALQISSFQIELNSIGCLNSLCRPAYLKAFQKHLKENSRKLCADCRRRAKGNPLRVLDCKEEKCQMVINTGPKLSESLCDACKSHHAFVREGMDDLSIPYKDNPRLVRGIDYYTKTVFEVVSTLPETDPVGRLSLGGGGRYDGLVKQLGGPAISGIGFSGGVERTVLQMKSEGVEVSVDSKPDIFLVHLGDLGRKKALRLFDDLRRAGFHIGEAFHKEGIKPQLRMADRGSIQWALILGQKEALDNTVILRNMESGIQETLDLNLDSLVPALKKRLHRDIGLDFST